LDEIVHLHYGNRARGQVEEVLAQNPGLAGKGGVLSAGVKILLPAGSLVVETEEVQLWG